RHTRCLSDWSSDVCSSDLSLKASADETAISVVLCHPDERRELLALEAGRWEAPEIISRVGGLARRNGAQCVVVESNAAQRYISRSEERRVGKERRTRGWRA